MVRVANPHNAGRSMWDVMNPSRQDGAQNDAARAKDDPYDMVAALERVSNQLGGGALSRHASACCDADFLRARSCLLKTLVALVQEAALILAAAAMLFRPPASESSLPMKMATHCRPFFRPRTRLRVRRDSRHDLTTLEVLDQLVVTGAVVGEDRA